MGDYVYIGGFQPHPDVLYIKAGKSTQLKTRVKGYGTMLPGGLTFMFAGKVERGLAGRGETAVMTALASIDGIEPIGGEWFKCQPIMRLTAIDTLKLVSGEIGPVRVAAPEPFGSREPGKRANARKKKKYRRAA